MYIVYDTNNAIESLRSKYLVLELDTVEFSDGKLAHAYAVVDSEHISFQELPLISNITELHEQLLENYRDQNWDFCIEAISNLRGNFKGELDTFYDELEQRIEILKTATIAPGWTGNILAQEADSSE
jgi:hypothetical protein